MIETNIVNNIFMNFDLYLFGMLQLYIANQFEV